jgi:predicted DNA-binding transcriptional regulator YafY
VPRASGPADRALQAFNFLRRRRVASTSEVARHLEVDADVARRDLHALLRAGLADQEGAGPTARWVLDTRLGSVEDPTAFDDISVRLGRDMTAFLHGTPLAQGLSALADEAETRDLRLDRKFHHHPEPARRYAEKRTVVEAILHALLDERRLVVTTPRRGRTETFVVEPLTLVHYRRAIYLLAREPGDPDVLHLAVDRIDAAESGERFQYPAEWNAADHLQSLFGIRPGGIPDRVILRFQPEVAHYVRARDWHATQRLVDRPDGGVELRMDVMGAELVRLACEWGQQVEVVEPAWLRDRVRDELAAALARYQRTAD